MKTRFGIFLCSMLSLTACMAPDIGPGPLDVGPGPPEHGCSEQYEACSTDADCCDAECVGGACAASE